MDLNKDAMLVSLRISDWFGRLYDREASAHHDASTNVRRYNKRLLPKAALAALMSEGRTQHYGQSLPWDDKGLRLFTVANYERYTEIMDGLHQRLVRQRACFIEDYDHYVAQARLDLGKLFRIEEYPSKEDLWDRFSIRYRITPVPDAEHFIAKLASDDTDRVKRDIERHIEEQLHDAVGDRYRRLADAVERVSERLNEDGDGRFQHALRLREYLRLALEPRVLMAQPRLVQPVDRCDSFDPSLSRWPPPSPSGCTA